MRFGANSRQRGAERDQSVSQSIRERRRAKSRDDESEDDGQETGRQKETFNKEKGRYQKETGREEGSCKKQEESDPPCETRQVEIGAKKEIAVADPNGGFVPFHYHQFDGGWKRVEGNVIEEGFVSIFVNGQEVATVMSSPLEPDKLALGFLYNEGIISSLDDVRALHPCPSGACIDVWLNHNQFELPKRKIMTSGCGGGVTFDDLSKEMAPLQSSLVVPAARITELMTEMQKRAGLYARARGVHTSALSDGHSLVALAEDVGRHNTIDRLRGDCLLRGIDPADNILLATGRISSEMINKAAKMKCPIIASRTSPTSMSVRLARQWHITLCGYVRRAQMNVYSHPQRLGLPTDALSDLSELQSVLVATG